MISPRKTTLLAALAAVLLLAADCGVWAVEKYPWLVVNYRRYDHQVQVVVNGEDILPEDAQGGGFVTRGDVLREGENTIRLRFTQRPGRRFPSSASVMLSPSMMPGGTPLPGIAYEEVEGYCVCVLRVEILDGIPQVLRSERREWGTPEKKQLMYEELLERGAFAKRFASERYAMWDEYGTPVYEEQYAEGALVSARYFKPDGSCGADVEGGNGWYREWYDDGTLAVEVPVQDGRENGTMTEYWEDGTLRAQTLFRDGEPVE